MEIIQIISLNLNTTTHTMWEIMTIMFSKIEKRKRKLMIDQIKITNSLKISLITSQALETKSTYHSNKNVKDSKSK